MKAIFVKVPVLDLYMLGLIFCVLMGLLFQGRAFADQVNRVKSGRLCFISDLNGSYGSIKLPASVDESMSYLRRLQCGLVIGAGDLVAGQDSTLSETRLREMWSGFDQSVLKPMYELDIPVLSAIGNHDGSAARSASGGYLFDRERQVASEFWNRKRQETSFPEIDWLDVRDFPFFYSVRFGTIGIIFIDGSSATEFRAQRVWLENQLRKLSADPSLSTRIVVGHLPLVGVAVGRDRPGEILADSRSLYELFDAHKVDFYVSGHHHAFFPGRVEEWSRYHGTVQLALGAMGDGPRYLLGNEHIPARNTLSFIDVDETIVNPELKFSVSTLLPRSGEYLFTESLPQMLRGIDGSGQFVPLKRADFRSVFPFPFP